MEKGWCLANQALRIRVCKCFEMDNDSIKGRMLTIPAIRTRADFTQDVVPAHAILRLLVESLSWAPKREGLVHL
jgi:hypothetical protein